MVNKIYELKNEILSTVEDVVHERGVERMDVDRVGKMIDMVHHLAEAESNCWQAEYYRTVTEAMNSKRGYTPGMSEGIRRNYGGGTGSSAGYYMGYNPDSFSDAINPVRDMMHDAQPDERKRMRNEVMSMIGAM